MTQLRPIPAGIVERFKRVQTGVVCDALGRLGLAGWMDGLHPAKFGAKMAGRARTLQFGRPEGPSAPAFNVYEIIRGLDPGDVLVFSTGRAPSWIFGENMAHAAMYQGAAGMVTDSRTRDGAELAELAMPCFSAGRAVRPPAGLQIVAVDVPVTCAGAAVAPGDLVVGDTDGLLAVAAARLADVLLQVEDLDMLERMQEAAIRDRVSLPELVAVLQKKKVLKT